MRILIKGILFGLLMSGQSEAQTIQVEKLDPLPQIPKNSCVSRDQPVDVLTLTAAEKNWHRWGYCIEWADAVRPTRYDEFNMHSNKISKISSLLMTNINKVGENTDPCDVFGKSRLDAKVIFVLGEQKPSNEIGKACVNDMLNILKDTYVPYFSNMQNTE